MKNSKVSYQDALKGIISDLRNSVTESSPIAEYDVSKMDYMGPGTEDILSFNPEGGKDKELKTHRSIVDILADKYAKEMDSEVSYVKEEIEDEPTEESELEIKTGEEPDEIDSILNDLEDYITDDETGASDEGYVTNESVENEIIARLLSEMEEVENEIKQDADEGYVTNESVENEIIARLLSEMEEVENEIKQDADEGYVTNESVENEIIARLLSEMEEVENEIKQDADEESSQAGTDAFDKEGNTLEKFLDDSQDGVEKDFAKSKHAAEEEKLNCADDEPLDIQEALRLLKDDLDVLDEYNLLEDLLFEDEDEAHEEHEKGETEEEEKKEHEIPGEKDGDDENEDEDSAEKELNVDKKIEEGRGLGPIQIRKDDEALMEAFKMFREELEKEIKDKMNELEPVKEDQEADENEIETGGTPAKVDATKKSLEDELLEMLYLEDIDNIEVPAEKSDEKEDDEKEGKKNKDEDEDEESVKECNEDFTFDDGLDFLTENEDLLEEILNSI